MFWILSLITTVSCNISLDSPEVKQEVRRMVLLPKLWSGYASNRHDEKFSEAIFETLEKQFPEELKEAREQADNMAQYVKDLPGLAYLSEESMGKDVNLEEKDPYSQVKKDLHRSGNFCKKKGSLPYRGLAAVIYGVVLSAKGERYAQAYSILACHLLKSLRIKDVFILQNQSGGVS